MENGTIINQYKIISAIGKGGMGEVFLAQDTKLNRKVALKILPPEFAEDLDRMSRFVREAQSASALNHPNIITIHEIGESDGTHFIATEFIDGKTLGDYAKMNPLNYKSALEIAIQIASALDEAHSAGIVHRDIKPDNVMIRSNGLAKILDFGIAKLSASSTSVSDSSEDATAIKGGTSPGMIIGTANYMSPEQAKGQAVDARSDIFSFGVVVYEMLSGKLPFAGETAMETIAAIINKEPLPLNADVPPEIERIISKSLRKERRERYQTIKDLLIDLKDVKLELEVQHKLDKTVSPDKEEPKTQILQAVATAEEANQTITAKNRNDSITIKKSNVNKAFVGALAVLLIAAIGFGYWFYAHRSVSTDSKQINSIAVLPFENGSGDANLDYLSDGLSESLIDKLSQLPQLKVIARSSSFKYRGANIDVQDAANKLGVQAIVMGKVVRVGDNLTVRVEMIDASENRQLWSEQYNRKAADLISVQQEIAQTASEKLRLRLSGAQEQQFAKREAVNPQAYELLLKGRFYKQSAGSDSLRKSAEFFEQAISADPNYALAYAELALMYIDLAASGLVDPKIYLPKAEISARKALELNENLSQAHLALARFKSQIWQWQEAEPEYRRAIELDPNYAEAHAQFSFFLSSLGRHDEAIAEAKRAQELDPVNNSVGVAYRLTHARRYDEAIAELKRIIELDRSQDYPHVILGYAYSGKGMYKEAISERQEATRLGDKTTSNQIYLGAAYARSGEREKAQAILKQLQTTKEYVAPGELAVLYTALGDKEAAFASLEKAFAEHDLQLQFLKSDPSFDPLRDDPRYADLTRRVGLPQ